MNRLPLVAALLALAACHPEVSGNGVLGTEARTVAPFDEVEISLGFEATVTANAATQELIISGDENLLQYVATPVEAGVLETRLKGVEAIHPIHPLRIIATATALHAARAAEAAHVDVKGAGSSDPDFTFEVEASGKGQVLLQGPGGGGLRVSLSGGSGLDAWAYPVAAANVALTGGSTLRLNATGPVSGTAAEASKVYVTGGGTCGAVTLTGGSTCQ